MIITIHIRHPLLLSLFYNIIINFTSVQCLFATLHDIFFGCTCAKLYSIKRFHPSACSQDLEECAFKQNLFIPPLVHNIWMCIQAKPFHPSPCSRHLDVHSSKTFSSLPLFTTFGCAFKQNHLIPPLVQDIWMCIQAKPFHPSLCSRHLHVHSSKTLPSLPSKPSCKYGGTRMSVHSHVLKICMPIQVTSCFFPLYLCKTTFGFYVPMVMRFWVCILSEKSSLHLHLGEITSVRM
jgi:hypothetical protein